MNDDIHALSGAYAVDAVDDLERARFEQHLANCPECQQEVASLRGAASELGTLANEMPSGALREKVLRDIKAVRPLPPPSITLTGPGMPPAADQPGTDQPATDQPATDERSAPARRPRRWAPRLVAAAAALAIGATGATIWHPWDTSTSQGQTTVAQQVASAPDAERVRISLPDGAAATVIRSKSLGRAILQTEKMPPAPSSKVYQAWLRGPDGQFISAGLMPGKSDQTIVLEGDAKDATAAGITVEPAGGSSVPTSTPIALFQFA